MNNDQGGGQTEEQRQKFDELEKEMQRLEQDLLAVGIDPYNLQEPDEKQEQESKWAHRETKESERLMLFCWRR